MKSILTVITALLIVSSVNSQTFRLKTTEDAEKVKTEQLNIEGKVFECRVSESLNYSIERVSQKTGKAYRQYLGYYIGKELKLLDSTSLQYVEKPVFSNKDQSKYWVFTLNSNGWPKKIYLTKV